MIFGFDSRASWDSLTPELGEKLNLSPFEEVLDFRAFHGRDVQFKYPTKTIIASFESENGGCPYYESVYFYVNCAHPPLRIWWDSQKFPSKCHFGRSEIISQDQTPILVRDWWRTKHYTCMSFQDTILDDFSNRNEFDFLQDSFEVEGTGRVNIYGYMLKGLSFGQCKELVNTDQQYESDLSLASNIVSDIIVLENTGSSTLQYEWKIYSKNGVLVRSGVADSERIDISTIPVGVYTFISYDDKGHFLSHKIVKY